MYQLSLWQMGRRCVYFGVFVYLVLRCLLGCCTWFSCCVANMRLSIMSGTVTSQAIGFPLAHGRRVVPSGRLLSSCIRLIGSLTAGILLLLLLTPVVIVISCLHFGDSSPYRTAMPKNRQDCIFVTYAQLHTSRSCPGLNNKLRT